MTTLLPFLLVSDRDSDKVAFDNTVSGLTATDVKAAIDELDSAISAGGGDVDGPGSATDTAIAIYSGTSGKIIQDTSVLIDGSSNVTGINDLTIGGNLDVNGTLTTIDTTNLAVEDSLIQLARVNNTTDTLDIGLVGLYDTSGSLDLYGGLFRDASDNKWKLFVDSQEDLSASNTVNTAATGYTIGTLLANVEGGTVSGLTTDIAIADGGTGAGTAGDARTNLGLVIGTDVQAEDAGLTSIAGLTTLADRMIYTTASDTYAVTALTSFARTLLDDADAATMRTTLGVDASGTDNSTGVTLAGALDYITISGQEITRNAIVLTTDVSGDLPFANIAQVATASFIGRDTAGTGDMEVLSVAEAQTLMNVADGSEANLTWLSAIRTSASDFTVDVTTALTLPQASTGDNEDNVEVSYNGLKQHKDEWSISGTTITFTAAIPTGVTDVELRVLA